MWNTDLWGLPTRLKFDNDRIEIINVCIVYEYLVLIARAYFALKTSLCIFLFLSESADGLSLSMS